MQETTALPVTEGAYVNPIRSKTRKEAIGLPDLLSGGSLETVGNSSSR